MVSSGTENGREDVQVGSGSRRAHFTTSRPVVGPLVDRRVVFHPTDGSRGVPLSEPRSNGYPTPRTEVGGCHLVNLVRMGTLHSVPITDDGRLWGMGRILTRSTVVYLQKYDRYSWEEHDVWSSVKLNVSQIDNFLYL